MSSEEPMMTGGLGGVREGTTDEVNEAVNAIKSELESKTSNKYLSIDVISHKTQTVAGRNFFVKVSARSQISKANINKSSIVTEESLPLSFYVTGQIGCGRSRGGA